MRDEYTFNELALNEVTGPGLTLSSPENAALLERLQRHWAKKEKRTVVIKKVKKVEQKPVIVINKYGIRTFYKSTKHVAEMFGYESDSTIKGIISKKRKLRGNMMIRYATDEEIGVANGIN